MRTLRSKRSSFSDEFVSKPEDSSNCLPLLFKIMWFNLHDPSQITSPSLMINFSHTWNLKLFKAEVREIYGVGIWDFEFSRKYYEENLLQTSVVPSWTTMFTVVILTKARQLFRLHGHVAKAGKQQDQHNRRDRRDSEVVQDATVVFCGEWMSQFTLVRCQVALVRHELRANVKI